VSDLIYRLSMELHDHQPAYPALLVEMSQLPSSAQVALTANISVDVHPLLIQPEFANLRAIGPALVAVQGEGADALSRLTSWAKRLRPGLCAWLTSRLSPADLAAQLSQANLVHGPDGEAYLLRWHAPHVVADLFSRQGAWTETFIGPLISWWVPDPDAREEHWRRYRGLAWHAPRALPVLKADPEHWAVLAGDAHEAHAVLEVLQRLAPTGFGDLCPGQRLGVVQLHLDRATRLALRRPEDRLDYVWAALIQPTLLTSESGHAAVARAARGETRLGELLFPSLTGPAAA
jgi:hypothetical protein